MVVLLVLLLLSNLWFGLAADSTGPSNSSMLEQYEAITKMLQEVENTQKKKKETCAKVKSAIASLAASKNWEVTGDQYGVISIKLPDGNTYVIDEQCRPTVKIVRGTLSPAHEGILATLAPGTVTMKDVAFSVDVSLFRTLLQILMYGAGIFWAVRAALRLIAGDLTETLITLFIGFIIVASIYVLYKWMPA